MDTILIAYATKHGSTHEVAEAIAGWLSEEGVETHTLPARDVRSLEGYDAVVLGAPLYMGRWHPDARGFVRRHRHALAARPFAAFALGPLKDDDGQWRGAHTQLDNALEGLAPVAVGLFGGTIVPETLHFPFSRMPAGDLRDWAVIERWAAALPAHLGVRVGVP